MKRIVTRRWMYSSILLAAINLTGCATLGFRMPGAMREDNAPKAGDRAPMFELGRLGDESKRVNLASFRNEKPVVLFFGSYT